MASIQPNTHSFIIKVWVNDVGQTKGRIVWQGRITHVPSGHLRHFVKVDEIASFVMPYLQQLGVKPTWSWRIRHWLRRTRHRSDDE
jgi:hypothetical protein